VGETTRAWISPEGLPAALAGSDPKDGYATNTAQRPAVKTAGTFTMYGLIGAQNADLIPARHYLANRVLHPNTMLKKSLTPLFLFAVTVSFAAGLKPLVPEYIMLDAAAPVLKAQPDWAPSVLTRAPLNSEGWATWVRRADHEVRERLDRGEEDSLSNLLRFGVTFTEEYRIDDEYFRRFGESSLVNAFAERRADDLIRAMSGRSSNQGVAEMKTFVERKGHSTSTPPGRARLKRYLLQNLKRLHAEFLLSGQQARTNRDQMFQQRGISLDSNLWPDFDLHQHLQRMAGSGTLPPASIRRVAIVGPGLDFVNKQEGVDYYPPQTIQPFAVVDSLLQLSLASPETIEIYTLDISSRVNQHIESARERAARGESYTLQLPWWSGGRWTDELRASFNAYWQALGSKIGDPVAPIPVPSAAAGIDTRAVRIRPAIVSRVHPVDMNIVFQRLSLPIEERFDLVIGTNIFLYYGRFEQSLARRNIAAMLKPEGYLLSSEKLPETVPDGLAQAMVTELPMTAEPVITDYVFSYRRGR